MRHRSRIALFVLLVWLHPAMVWSQEPAATELAETAAAVAELIVESTQAFQGGDADKALALAQKALRAADDDQLRLNANYHLALIHNARREFKDAIKVLRAAERLTVEPSRKFEIQLTIAKLRAQTDDWEVADTARFLVETRPSDNKEQTYFVVQNEFLHHHINQILSRNSERLNNDQATIEEVEKSIVEELEAMHKELIETGVNAQVALVVYYGLARFHWDHLRLVPFGDAAEKFAPVLDSDLVAPIFKIKYWNLAGLSALMQLKFADAELAFVNCRRLADDNGVVFMRLSAENQLGLLEIQRGDFEKAISWLKPATEGYEDPAQARLAERAYALLNLAKAVESHDGDFSQAKELFEQALALPAIDDTARYLCLNNLGVNRYNVGEFKVAEEIMAKALSSAEQLYGESSLRSAETNVNIGWLELNRGRFQEAELRFANALEMFESELGKEHNRTAEAMSYYARVLAMQGNVDAARQQLVEAVELRRDYVQGTLSTALSQRDRLAFVQELRTHKESLGWPGVFDTFVELAPQLGIAATDQYSQVLSWKGVVQRHASAHVDDLEDSPEVRLIAKKRESLLNELRAVYFSSVSRRKRRARAEKLRALERQIDDQEKLLRRESDVFSRSADGSLATPDQIASALPPDSAFLDFVEVRHFERHAANAPVTEKSVYVAFVILPGQPPIRCDLGDAVDLNGRMELFYESLKDRNVDYHAPAQQITERLYIPLSRAVRDQGVDLSKLKTVILSGDGSFHRLPFAALPINATGVWGQTTNFVSISDANHLVRERVKFPGRPRLVAMGDVDYSASSELVKLPESRREVMTISRLFNQAHDAADVALVTNELATKPKILGMLPSANYVHLATHGSFLNRQDQEGFQVARLVAQLDSGLWFAGGNDARVEDTFATAEEIGRLDLRRTQLCVLSACETGLGHSSSGQGLIGLISALEQAGVQSTVSALWKVDDEATYLLMKIFYQYHWGDELSVAESLRLAQNEFIQGNVKSKTGESLQDPYYWAAFGVTGNGF